MKMAKQILSLFLSIVMVLSVFSIVAVAAEPATVEFVAEETATDGVYKITTSIECTKILNNFNICIYFDKTVFTLLKNTGVSGVAASSNKNWFNLLGQLKDKTEYYEGDEHPVYGEVVDPTTIDGDYEAINGEGEVGVSAYRNQTAAAIFGTLDSNKYQAMQIDWTADFENLAYQLNCKSKTAVFEFYLEVIDPTAIGTHTIGALAGAVAPVINYDANDSIYSRGTAGSLVPAETTVSNATITIEEKADPELEIKQYRDQVRYNDGNFDYRTVYKIVNFDEIFTGLEDADARIIDAGFIWSTDEKIDVAVAKAQVEGGAVEYSQVKRCYISTSFEQGQYVFTCLVKGIDNAVGEKTGDYVNKDTNLSALGYIIYKDADGNTAYAYYDYTLDVDALYKQYK